MMVCNKKQELLIFTMFSLSTILIFDFGIVPTVGLCVYHFILYLVSNTACVSALFILDCRFGFH